MCDGDTVALFPFAGNPNFTYTWDPTGGLDISEPNNPLAFPNQTTEYFVTVTDGLCEVVGDILVVVQDTPMLSFETFTDCRSLEIQINNTSIGGILFEWDFGDGSPPILGENPTYTYDQPGQYLITLTSADGCDVVTADVITVAAILDSVDDTSISCFSETVDLNPDGDEALYEYVWEPADGLSSSTAGNPSATVDQTTTFFVTITDILNPDCFVLDSVTVVVPDDFDLDAPADSSYCGSPEITLQAENSDLDYVWTDIDGTILSESGTLTVQPLDTTAYVLTGTDMFGCTKSDTVTLNPTFFAYTVSPDVIICDGDDTTIFVLNLDPNQDLSYVWSPAEFIVGDNTVSNPTVQPEGDVLFTVEITNNTLGCMLTEEVLVSASDFDYTISQEQTICLGENTTLTITNNDTTVLDYLWSPAECIVDGGDGPSPTVTTPETKWFYVDILNTDYGCITQDSVLVNVSWFDPDELEVFASPDTIYANSGEFFELWTNQADDLDYMWSGEGIVNNTLPVIQAAPTTEGEFNYCVTVTNADQCVLEGCINNALTVLDPDCDMTDIYIPNAFSPNGDGENDELRVYSNFIMDMELVIYNRWGQEVFRSLDQDIAWDGRFENEVLAPDVFAYRLTVTCPPNKSYETQGSITLVR